MSQSENRVVLPEARKPWRTPESTPRGSVSELVQQTKLSNGNDDMGGQLDRTRPPAQ